MRRRIRIGVCPSKLVLSLACVLAFACAQTGSSDMSAEPHGVTPLHDLVERYIAATKGWPRSDYSIRREGMEGHLVVFMVLHGDDLKEPVPGGGKSVKVYVDPAKMKVSKEMRFQ